MTTRLFKQTGDIEKDTNKDYNPNNRIWIDNIESLYSSWNIFPQKDNSKEENFNNISRLLILVFLIFYCILDKKDVKKKKHIEIMILFILSIFLLSILYFRSTKKEYFKELNKLSSINNNNNYNIREMDTPPVYKYPLLQTSKSMEKLSPTPIIYPRSHDGDIWALPSYKHSATNNNRMGYVLTDEYEPLNYTDEFDPRVNTYRSDFGLLNLNQYCNNQNGNKTQNANVSQISPNGQVINSDYRIKQDGTVLNPDNVLKITDVDTTKWEPKDLKDQTDTSTPLYELQKKQGVTTERYGKVLPPADWRIKIDEPNPTPYSTISERYDGNNSKTFIKYIPLRGDEDMTLKRPELTLANNQGVVGFLPNEMINETVFREQRQVMENSKLKNRAAHMYTTDPNALPPNNLMINKTPISMYGPGMVNVPERTKYTQNIQPNIYSFSDTAEPINANMGISYNPDLPPRVVDQVAMYDGAYPLYHRIDPQLVREGGIAKERLEEMPRRTQWSAKYNTYDTIDGSVNFEDIYDPRFTGYGDEYRSYVDINLGNVQYYYSDIDAYRDPNFGTRSKVDFIDFVDPMGRIKPEYSRQVGLNDVKENVQNQYDADSIYFREDLMERLMRKRNQELWQLRAAPLRKSANSHFSSVY
uniref:Minor capsid protein P9 transmembrane helices domain-containing protein n=1 Tax=viral metagenome TaxID=1070528 RepID=A0A6C0I5D6_9ZZZZ